MAPPEPLSKEEQAAIEWGLSCSTGGLDADGVRAYMEPWIVTVNHLRGQLQAEEQARRQEAARREEAEERLADWEDGVREIMERSCAGGVIHCTCVPALRKRVEQEAARADGAERVLRQVEQGHYDGPYSEGAGRVACAYFERRS